MNYIFLSSIFIVQDRLLINLFRPLKLQFSTTRNSDYLSESYFKGDRYITRNVFIERYIISDCILQKRKKSISNDGLPTGHQLKWPHGCIPSQVPVSRHLKASYHMSLSSVPPALGLYAP